MLKLELKVNLDVIAKDVNDLFLKQIPYASFLALNETLFKTTRDVKKTMPFFIQGGPIPFTKRGVQYKRAKNKRALHGEVFIPDAQWKYMQWVIDGGDKKWNKSKHGISVPIQENVRFNKYGNIPGKKRKEDLWREILNRGKGRTAVPIKGALSKKQFIATINGVTGLWQRLGKDGRAKIKLIMMFTHDAIPYRKRFPFRKFTTKFAIKHFKKSFNKKLTDVVKKEMKRMKVR